MARLGGAVAGQAGDEGVGVQGRRDQRGRPGDDPVEDDGHPQGARTEQEADDRGVFEPAHRGEHPDRVRRIGGVQGQCPPYDVDLDRERRVVDAGPATGDRCGVQAQHRGDQRGRGRGVGDPHVPGEQAAVPGGDQLAGHHDAHLHRGEGLLARHRRLHGHVGGAGPHPPREQAVDLRQCGGDTDVDHHDGGADLGGEGVHDGPAGEEVPDHLAGYLLRPGRHALRVHPMVSGEDSDHGGLGQGGRVDPGQAGQLHRDGLQDPECTARLGEPVLVLLRRGHRGGVEGAEGGERLAEGGHRPTVRKACTGAPATA